MIVQESRGPGPPNTVGLLVNNFGTGTSRGMRWASVLGHILDQVVLCGVLPFCDASLVTEDPHFCWLAVGGLLCN